MEGTDIVKMDYNITMLLLKLIRLPLTILIRMKERSKPINTILRVLSKTESLEHKWRKKIYTLMKDKIRSFIQSLIIQVTCGTKQELLKLFTSNALSEDGLLEGK